MRKFQMEFNGIDFSEYLIVEEVRRPFLPSSDFLTEQVMNKRGSLFFKRENTEEVIEADIRLIRNSRQSIQELKRFLQRSLYTDKPAKLILRDNPTVFNLAILGKTELEVFLRTGFTTLEFICHDPTNYSLYEQTYALKQGDNTIYYNGTYPAGFVARISGASGTDLDIRSITTGDYIRITGNPVASDKYLIDTKKEFVTKNNVSDMKNIFFESDFFYLLPGENKIRLSSGNGEISYREQGFDG